MINTRLEAAHTRTVSCRTTSNWGQDHYTSVGSTWFSWRHQRHRKALACRRHRYHSEGYFDWLPELIYEQIERPKHRITPSEERYRFRLYFTVCRQGFSAFSFNNISSKLYSPSTKGKDIQSIKTLFWDDIYSLLLQDYKKLDRSLSHYDAIHRNFKKHLAIGKQSPVSGPMSNE